MTYALPAGPRPAPRRQLFMSTGIAAAAGTMLMGGMRNQAAERLGGASV